MWGEKKRQEKKRSEKTSKNKKDSKTPLSLDQSTVQKQADHHDDSGRRI
jgi:hypothetical protein